MKKVYGALALLVSVGFAQQAFADVVIATPSLTNNISVGGNEVTFDGNTNNGNTAITYPNTAPAAGNFTAQGIAFSGGGIVVNNNGGDSAGVYATPLNDSSNYMAILGGSSETLAFNGLKSSFGLYIGSLDYYNSFTFINSVDLTSYTLTGAQLLPLLSNGDQFSSSTNRYVTFTGAYFDSVVLSSSQNSLEFDNVVVGVPEPTTWAMLILGFLGLGFLSYRRSARSSGASFRMA